MEESLKSVGAVDSRGAGYSREERDPRVSVYEAWMGVRRRGGRLAVRGGHLWIADLGALGSLAGAQVEWRSAASGRADASLRIIAFQWRPAAA